jgi:hypothetical protein
MHEFLLIKLYYYVCEEYNNYLRWNVQRFSPKSQLGQISDEEIITIYLFCMVYEEKYKMNLFKLFIMKRIVTPSYNKKFKHVHKPKPEARV